MYNNISDFWLDSMKGGQSEHLITEAKKKRKKKPFPKKKSKNKEKSSGSDQWKKDTLLYIDRAISSLGSSKDTDFLKGLKKFVQEKGFLSDEQKQALADATKDLSFDKKVKGEGSGKTQEEKPDKQDDSKEQKGEEKSEDKEDTSPISKEDKKKDKVISDVSVLNKAFKGLKSATAQGIENVFMDIVRRADPTLTGVASSVVGGIKGLKNISDEKKKDLLTKANDNINTKIDKEIEGIEDKIEKLKDKEGNEKAIESLKSELQQKKEQKEKINKEFSKKINENFEFESKMMLVNKLIDY